MSDNSQADLSEKLGNVAASRVEMNNKTIGMHTCLIEHLRNMEIYYRDLADEYKTDREREQNRLANLDARK